MGRMFLVRLSAKPLPGRPPTPMYEHHESMPSVQSADLRDVCGRDGAAVLLQRLPTRGRRGRVPWPDRCGPVLVPQLPVGARAGSDLRPPDGAGTGEAGAGAGAGEDRV